MTSPSLSAYLEGALPWDAPDLPECDRCGCPQVARRDRHGDVTLSCPDCETRAARHRTRGRTLTRTATARRGFAQRARQISAHRTSRGAQACAAISHPDFLPF